MTTTETLDSLIPITMFNKGQASKIFDKLNSRKELIVLKNNTPSAVIVSPDEYKRMTEIEENYYLLLEAVNRMKNNENGKTYSETEMMNALSLTEEDIAAAEDVEIE